MQKRITNFSSLGLQDLYENNQIYSEFLGDVLMKKLNNFVCVAFEHIVWTQEFCCENGREHYEWKARCAGACQLHMKMDK